jgi:transcription initiation factor IIF auxiliary subunit
MVTFPLTLTIENTAEYGPFDQERKMRWYDWEIHIECEDKEFWNEIRTVVYHLHPSFPISELQKKNKEDKFRLSSRGWGEFKIGVEMILRDNRSAQVDYWLHLGKDVCNSRKITLTAERFKAKGPNKRFPFLKNIY